IAAHATAGASLTPDLPNSAATAISANTQEAFAPQEFSLQAPVAPPINEHFRFRGGIAVAGNAALALFTVFLAPHDEQTRLLIMLSGLAFVAGSVDAQWIFAARSRMSMGAVQDTEDEADNVMLDMRGVRVAKDAAFRVEDERGKMLGAAGDPPRLETEASAATVFRNVEV
ncbi:hypothetical protein B4Q13_24975, partial [Lacticaseibacillus rhamnosus]